MIYGLYQSATGVLTNSYRQDVIANNIANSETIGFKRDLALFQQRPTEARARGSANETNPLLEALGGGILASPTLIDTSQGELEHTGRALDVAVEGSGYFKVNDNGQTRLTRDGRFMVDRTGRLIMSNGTGQQVMDLQSHPIKLDPTLAGTPITVDQEGNIYQGNKPVGRLGLFEVADPSKLRKVGGNLLSYPDSASLLPGRGKIRGEFIERGNVEPATELTHLMDAQRQLEANANMIRYQDATLARLVNDVGKIS
jgi:flagellar basal body rod protein FlgG